MSALLPLMLMMDDNKPSKIKVIQGNHIEDLIAEYQLIQQKKSKLSRSQRDSVVSRYNYLVKRGSIVPVESQQQEQSESEQP